MQRSVHESSPADLLALGLGSGGDEFAFEEAIDLGAFLCECPELELQGCLGRGGMGVVYRARQVRLDRDVAVKLMSPELARDPEFADRFEREAKAMARLQHPGIIAVHDFGTAAGIYYIVMELVDGPNLRQLMQAPIDAEQASDIVGQLCSALAYAHEEGVVHRDIKPENVLLDRSGRVRIADFGLAKLQAKRAGATAHRTRRVLGTPQYMAPEQISDPSSVDNRSDIFAIGVVFYEMLTGQLPVGRFEAPSAFGRCDTRLDDIVLRALESRREQRFQTATELEDALSTSRDVQTQQRAAAQARPRRRWLWAAGLSAPIAAAALTYSLAERDETPTAAQGEAASSDGSGGEEAPRGGLRLDRWPAKELGMLHSSAVAIGGIDYSQLRQAPAIARLGAQAFGGESGLPETCRTEVLDRTHKIVVGTTAKGKLVDIIVHADWEIAELEACLTEAAKTLSVGGEKTTLRPKSEAFDGHRKITVDIEEDRYTATLGKRESTIVITMRPISSAEMDRMLAGETAGDPYRSDAVAELDFTAPVWVFAKPDPSLMPLDIVEFQGTIDVWDQLAMDASFDFETEEAATSAKTLMESYVNVIASIPDVGKVPQVEVEQSGTRLHSTLRADVPRFDFKGESTRSVSFGVTVKK